MTQPTFEAIILRFTKTLAHTGDYAYQLTVRQTPKGLPLPGGSFRADIETALTAFYKLFSERIQIDYFFLRFEDAETQSDLTKLGNAFYALLPENFQEDFRKLVQRLLERGDSIRLILEASEGEKADHLLNLPWEILCTESTDLYLARSPRLLIVRRLLDVRRRASMTVAPPLNRNVLHVIAHHDNDAPRYHIDESLRQMEREIIPKALGSDSYHLVQNPGSVEQLQEALSTGDYHIMHFLGHGEMANKVHEQLGNRDPVSAWHRGYLRFFDRDGKPQPTTGEQLEVRLQFTPSVQLVVLNACHGNSSFLDANMSIAARTIALDMVRSGLPYVVAMQGQITQEAAKHFIQAFYKTLQAGHDIAYAVAVGRAMIAANMPNTIDWCLPILYTNQGLPEPSIIDNAAEFFAQWMRSPGASRKIGFLHIGLGSLYLLIGGLLLISNANVNTPDLTIIKWLPLLFPIFPIILTTILYTAKRQVIQSIKDRHVYQSNLSVNPDSWSLTMHLTLLVHVLATASIMSGLSIAYVGLIVHLTMITGFWQNLSWIAHIILVAILLIPCLFSGYAQTIAFGRWFTSWIKLEPKPDYLQELSVLAVGIFFMISPWLGMQLFPNWVTSTWSSVIIGIPVIILGVALYLNDE